MIGRCYFRKASVGGDYFPRNSFGDVESVFRSAYKLSARLFVDP